jgi:hypothetical protein
VLLSIIEKGGIIGKAYIKEMQDDYKPCLKLQSEYDKRTNK